MAEAFPATPAAMTKITPRTAAARIPKLRRLVLIVYLLSLPTEAPWPPIVRGACQRLPIH